MTYEATIGLEVHAELKTNTKMFCSSHNDADAMGPNANVCPVCLAHPGTLPVINREAVRHVLKVGLALGGKLADYTEFDRKNYFYPDLPKGYQISQYEFPIVSGGNLHGVPITRVHLEEDTASSVHDDATGATLIDFNRAGVPLMELVTEPEIHSAEQAGNFARELQLLLRYLGVSNANMEKGEMRVEANISVAKDGGRGTKVEIKNLNSFRVMERAVEYEIKRQSKLLDEGGIVIQETRGWDEGKQQTFAQRVKEGSADYRYFPDPDLPSLMLSEVPEFEPTALRASLPELPRERRERYLALGIKKDDAELFIAETSLGAFFDGLAETLPKEHLLLAANYIANDLVNILRDIEGRDSGYSHEMPISRENFSKIIEMAGTKKVSSRAAKDLLLGVVSGKIEDPAAHAASEGLLSNTDTGQLESIVAKVLSDNPAVVAEYKGGKVTSLEYLVGQSMKALRGAADPVTLRSLIKKQLEA